MRIFPLPHGQRYDHLSAKAHQLGDHPGLDGREAGKAVEYHHASRQEPGPRHGPAHHVQSLLGGDEIALDVFQKAPVQLLQVSQLLHQGTSLFREGDQLPHILRADAVLHEFGDGALHLVDIALSVEEAPQGGQLLLQAGRHLLEHQALARVVQHGNLPAAHLLQDAVPQAPEAEHVYVQDAAPVAQEHQVFLGLHGELVGHDDQEVLLWILQGPAGDLFI